MPVVLVQRFRDDKRPRGPRFEFNDPVVLSPRAYPPSWFSDFKPTQAPPERRKESPITAPHQRPPAIPLITKRSQSARSPSSSPELLGSLIQLGHLKHREARR